MSFFFDLAAGICGVDVDEDEEDEIDFCGMPSDQIVEIAIRRDFLLLRLQALVDAETLEDADAAMVAMEKEAGTEDKFLMFLVRAGTVEIIRGSKLMGGGGEPMTTPDAPLSRSVAAGRLMKKLMPYHEQRRLRELEKRQRGSWGRIMRNRMG